ncbi:MAG: tetratricopeptide repeat protein [Candidatus Sulfotelmatobacter sp.]
MFRSRPLILLTSCAIIAVASGTVQSQSKTVAGAADSARTSISLAETGHCVEALPLLRKNLPQAKSRDLKLKTAVEGVRCAMTLHQVDAALEFLRVLTREFPKDPDALYVSVHAYSDLSTMTSQKLATDAPGSYQAHELLAEAFESQGKWDDAEKEYRGILKNNPHLPGIHFRLGRLLLSRPNPTPEAATQAKQEFVDELKIDPKNAGAEYVLGEMARQSQQWDEAVNHFSRAAKLDPQFGEAFLALGMALNAEKQYADAVAPLETAVKLEPRNPDAHYNLAMAFARSGHKEEGDKEFAIHQSLIGEQSGNTGQGSSSNQPQ